MIPIAQQLKMIKGMVEMLNEQHPITTSGIPIQRYDENKQLVNKKVIPFPHFTAVQSIDKTYWWIHCTDYNVWHTEEFDYLSKAFQEITKENGFELHFAFVFIVGLNSVFEQSRINKTIFIGKHHSTLIDG